MFGTQERLEKKLEKKNANGEDKERVAADSVVTPDGVEALKAFTSPVNENKET